MLLKFKNKIGIIIILILTLLTLALWTMIEPLSVRFFGVPDSLTSLGQISGLIGFTLISLGIILSARLSFMEEYFGGMDSIYRYHHFLNGTGFLLILLHPIILAFKYLLISTTSAAMFLLPGTYWPQNAGIMALLGFIVFLALSIFFSKIPYHLRKLNHKFLGFVYILAILHSFFIASDISRNASLRLYMTTIAGLAIISFIYRAILSEVFVRVSDYKVQSIKNLPGKVFEIELSPIKNAIKFIPGQFVFISFRQKNFEEEAHPFTLTSSDKNNNLIINIKSLGDYTSNIDDIKVGTTAKIEGPFGKFFQLGDKNLGEIWVAGGIGITPFLSYARSLSEGADKKIDFYYSVSSKNEALYIDELTKITGQHGNFRLIPYYIDDEPCYLNAEIIQKKSGNLIDKNFYICASPTMTRKLKRQLKELGVSGNQIYFEEFQLL